MRALLVALTLVLTLLPGCANHALEDLEARLGTLMGASEEDLVRRMGVPSRSYDTEGRKFLAYLERWSDPVVTPHVGFGGGFGHRGFHGAGLGYGFNGYSQTIERFCETTFEVVRGKVAGYALRGSSCGWGGLPVIAPA